MQYVITKPLHLKTINLISSMKITLNNFLYTPPLKDVDDEKTMFCRLNEGKICPVKSVCILTTREEIIDRASVLQTKDNKS